MHAISLHLQICANATVIEGPLMRFVLQNVAGITIGHRLQLNTPANVTDKVLFKCHVITLFKSYCRTRGSRRLVSLRSDRSLRCIFFKLWGEGIRTCDRRLTILINKPGLVQISRGFWRALLVVTVEMVYWLALLARLFSNIDGLESLPLLMLSRWIRVWPER